MVVVEAKVEEDSGQTFGLPQVDIEVGTDIGGGWFQVGAKQLVCERLAVPVAGQGSARKVSKNFGRAGATEDRASSGAGQGGPLRSNPDGDRTGQSGAPLVCGCLKSVEALLPESGTGVASNGGDDGGIVEADARRVVIDDSNGRGGPERQGRQDKEGRAKADARFLFVIEHPRILFRRRCAWA